MKTLEISDEVYTALQRLAAARRQTPAETVAGLLGLPTAPETRSDPLVVHLLESGILAEGTDAERYLSILGWVAERHSAEFTAFVGSLGAGRRFLASSRDEIVAQCRHNQARPVPGSGYWAMMNLDSPTKRRFLARVLAHAGYSEDVIAFACQSIGRVSLPRRPAQAAA